MLKFSRYFAKKNDPHNLAIKVKVNETKTNVLSK